jgi:hypothetical protein
MTITVDQANNLWLLGALIRAPTQALGSHGASKARGNAANVLDKNSHDHWCAPAIHVDGRLRYPW